MGGVPDGIVMKGIIEIKSDELEKIVTILSGTDENMLCYALVRLIDMPIDGEAPIPYFCLINSDTIIMGRDHFWKELFIDCIKREVVAQPNGSLKEEERRGVIKIIRGQHPERRRVRRNGR